MNMQVVESCIVRIPFIKSLLYKGFQVNVSHCDKNYNVNELSLLLDGKYRYVGNSYLKGRLLEFQV